MIKNVAGQNVSAQMITVADGSDFTGTVTVTVTKDNGTQTAGAGTVTNKGGGETNYAPTQAETNADFISFNFAGTGAITTGLKVYTTFPQTGDNFARLGAPAGSSVSADNAAIKVVVDAIPTTAMRGTDGVDTATMRGTDGANTVVPDAAGTSPTAVENRQEMDTNSTQLAKLGAPAGISISADNAAIKGVVDGIPTTAMRGTDSAATSAKQDTMETTLNAIPTTAMRGTDSAATSSKQDTMETTLNAIPTTPMRGTDGSNTVTPATEAQLNARTLVAANYATATSQATAQDDLDIITGNDGATLATLQPNEDFGAITKSAAFPNFEFLMVASSDHATPVLGLTVTAQRSIDGAAFASVSGVIAEVSNGIYQFGALAADTNGNTITWRFSAATADDNFVTFKTVS